MAVTDFPHKAFSESEGESGRSLRDRLVPSMPRSALWGWIGPLIVAVFGAVVRFVDLGRPRGVVFDETYYMKDGYSLLTWGVERVTVKDADKLVLAGRTGEIWKQCAADKIGECASYVVHPPLGKWMIAVGEWLFGLNPLGWRAAAAFVGALSILIIARVARRMTRSTLLGCFAGLMLALDGLHFVLSRTALLDIFLMFWVLAGFACLVVDRDKARSRLVDWYETSALSDRGPYLGVRPWRLAAGLCLGAACAVKWSGVFFLIGFAIMSMVWDAGARKAVGLRRPYSGALEKDVPSALMAMALVPAITYVVSWTGWFVNATGYGRNWAEATSQGPVHFVINSIGSWIGYHFQVLGFHNQLDSTHPYQSEPWSWPLLLRPVAFFYEGRQNACGVKDCSEAVLGVGTPVIWYGALAALIAMVAWYVSTRDWRAGAVLLAYLLGWLPWFYWAIADNRTMFLFYAAPMVPFMVLALTLAAGLIIGPSTASPSRRMIGAALTGAFALLALINFGWLYPVLSGEVIPYAEWNARMLFKSRWI